MTIKQIVERINKLHEEKVMHENRALDCAIKAGELLFKQRATLPKGTRWIEWIATNFPKISQRTIYNYIDCYMLSIEDPKRVTSARSIREVLGESLAGIPRKVISQTKLQRILLAVAKEFEPDPKARALAHAIMGTDSKIAEVQPLIADWVDKLQFTPAIK
jgi:hypothetical protein